MNAEFVGLDHSLLGPPPPGPTDEQLARLHSMAAFANREEEAGFPLLLAHTLVGIWSALEAFVEDFAAALFERFPDALDSLDAGKIRVPLRDFLAATEADRRLLLVSHLRRADPGEGSAGVTGFENLFKRICLDGTAKSSLEGEVDGRVRRVLFEAHMVRNVLAHRGGVADRRLCEACPGLGLSPGDRVVVTDGLLEALRASVLIYALTLLNRASALQGGEIVTDVGDPPVFAGALDVRYKEALEHIRAAPTPSAEED